MAKALGDARKIVVSDQQLEFTWRNSEQLQGDLVKAVTALKNQPGGSDIVVSGSKAFNTAVLHLVYGPGE
jgi:dihydrofolate reductase